MTSPQQIQIVAGCALASVFYMLPTLLAVIRRSPGALRIFLLNLCLGWTLAGWVCALQLACRGHVTVSRTAEEWAPWMPGRPEAALSLPAGRSTYVDGSYLVSEHGSARTWAVCSAGRWGVAYELDGLQRTAAWVDSSDVPLDVLAHALVRDRESRR